MSRSARDGEMVPLSSGLSFKRLYSRHPSKQSVLCLTAPVTYAYREKINESANSAAVGIVPEMPSPSRSLQQLPA
eukprot:5807710-Pleurochrysis_carterae.AAC.1